jgi:hypothetical protein
MTAQETTTRPLVPPPADKLPRRVRLGALVLALFVAGVHLGLAEDRYDKDAAWVGAVFIAAALVLTIAASVAAAGAKFPDGLVEGSWFTNAAVAAGLFALFVLSRTVGLPGYHRGDVPVTQVLALVAEAAYVAVFLVAVRTRRRAGQR